MPAPTIPCAQYVWLRQRCRIRPLTIPSNVTIIGKRWRLLHPNPLRAWQLCTKRSFFQHQRKRARYHSWVVETDAGVVR